MPMNLQHAQEAQLLLQRCVSLDSPVKTPPSLCGKRNLKELKLLLILMYHFLEQGSLSGAQG